MKKHSFRPAHFGLMVMTSALILFSPNCGIGEYSFIKAFNGPDLPPDQIAKLYLDKGLMFRIDRDRPISFVVDGQPFEAYKLNERTPCLFLLPGEHEVIIRPLPQMRAKRVEGTTTMELFKVFPIPEQFAFKLMAEKGGEYLVAQDYFDQTELNYIVLWLEDRISKKKISEEIRFEWK